MFPFGSGIQKAAIVGGFKQMARRDQDGVMQYMYDEGYSGKEIGNFFGIPAQTVYSRIDANRGRGPNVKPA